MSANESGCYISTETSLHTRRCFMTGEYCSQKTNIQRERNSQIKKWEKGIQKAQKQEGLEIEPLSVTAFVIMDFSDMSDVVYKWRIEPFIQSLHKYLYLDKKGHRLYCYTSADQEKPMGDGRELNKVKKVRVVRSDSDPASNYVICSRICQQMQIADLIIVDVSKQNPNVFYEFGMAVALDKLILPICYSESFYKIEYPKMLKKLIEEGRLGRYVWTSMEKHIGCYPWQKCLLEYYGIRYKQKDDDNIKYLTLDKIVEKQYGFSDEMYNRFPYDDEVQIDESHTEKIGQFIYKKLKKQFEDASVNDNTLIVYTIDGFLNEEQAGRCIVNFYRSITRKMQKEQCFRGERVGVLVQENVIPESDKDTEIQRNLPYYIGEIIHIGVNQATFLATKEKVKAEDVFKVAKYIGETKTTVITPYVKEHRKEILRFVKQYIQNRGMIIYPNNPVYVKRVKYLLTDFFANLDEGEDYADRSFCLYHVMLKNLRYVNEIVVDITSNCLQSLFWLGAAHGSEIYAVTVKSELSEKQKELMHTASRSRNVFDVSGLWTAYFYSHDTEGFYHQLALAQLGIERHSKIIPSDATWRAIKRWEYFELDEAEPDEDDTDENEVKKGKSADEKLELELDEKKKSALESYYRRRFWNAMLRYNRLRIYLTQYNDKDNEELRLRTAKWDMDAVSSLTHYISKRTVIGEYMVISLAEEDIDSSAEDVNFICVGQPAQPLEKKIHEHINEKCRKTTKLGRGINQIHMHNKGSVAIDKTECECKDIQIKGFKSLNDCGNGLYMYLPWAKCAKCPHSPENEKNSIAEEMLTRIPKNSLSVCPIKGCNKHKEIAQLVLWREDGERKNQFRVSIIGNSGPATFGLSSLFVDEEQKLCDFLTEGDTRSDDNNGGYLLYELQKHVRERVYELLNTELVGKIGTILGLEQAEGAAKQRLETYRDLATYAVYSYLSTILYRYFLPFLTEKDIDRIFNEVYMFINSMKAEKQSPFSLNYKTDAAIHTPAVNGEKVKEIIKMLPEAVKQFLKEFKGLEAFYEVNVELDKDKLKKISDAKGDIWDVRKVTAVKALANEQINLFIVRDSEINGDRL